MDADRLASFFGPPRQCAGCFAQELANRPPACKDALPSAYAGPNHHISGAVVAAIIARPELAHLHPHAGEGDAEIVWNQYIFDNVIVGPPPEGGVKDPLTKSASPGGQCVLRYGMALVLPYGFGQDRFDAEIARLAAATAAAIVEDARAEDGASYETLIGHADMQLAQNVATKVIVGNFTIYYRTVKA